MSKFSPINLAGEVRTNQYSCGLGIDCTAYAKIKRDRRNTRNPSKYLAV